jgi:formylglycine-generating enzyme required for sulfatase activity
MFQRFFALAVLSGAIVMVSDFALAAQPIPASVFKDCDDCPEMVRIPSGTFQMGSSRGGVDEQPIRTVSVQRFALGKYEVTQRQWRALMGSNPSIFSGDDLPVENISWEEAQEFARRLSQKTGKSYRLLSEAEWEYAARAGSQTEYSFGDTLEQLEHYAWYRANSGGRTHPVGLKRANAFGLHDIHGNVWEWVQDCWNGSYSGAPIDGRAWDQGDCSRRVLRGGSWFYTPEGLRSARRNWFFANSRNDIFGFRIARND